MQYSKKLDFYFCCENGMFVLTCNHWGIEIINAKKWSIGFWSRIRAKRFQILGIRIEIHLGEVPPYNPQTGIAY